MKLMRISLFLLLLCCQPAIAEEPVLTNEAAAILYFQLSEEPLPMRTMMLSASPDFDNEFDRREFLQQQKLVNLLIVNATEQQEKFVRKVRARIGEYDFSNEYFPLEGIHETTYLTIRHPDWVYGPQLAVEILNSSEFRQLQMAPETARALHTQLGGNPTVILRFVLRPVRSEHKDFSGGRSFNIHRSLAMYAESMQILHGEDETVVAKIQPTSRFEDHAPVDRLLTESSNQMMDDPWAQAWGSSEHFDALVTHYNLENWSSFQRMEIAEPCVQSFGYSACQRIISRRQQLVSRCYSTLKNQRLCERIRGIPYTEAEHQRR